jgi:hypothetical protein
MLLKHQANTKISLHTQYISPATEQQNWVCRVRFDCYGYNRNKHLYVTTWIWFKDVACHIGSKCEIPIHSSQSVRCHTYSNCKWCAQREVVQVSFTQACVDWYHADMALWIHAPKVQGYTYEPQNFIAVCAIKKIHILISFFAMNQFENFGTEKK